MKYNKITEFSYFPGCSLASSEKENSRSIKNFFNIFDIHLIELEDWNCCGSSSIHCIDSELGFELLSRNISLCEPNTLLFVPCPSCYLKFRKAYHYLENNEERQAAYQNKWKKPFPKNLYIPHLFELLEMMEQLGLFKKNIKKLNGLKCVPYYGCMLSATRELRQGKNFNGTIENIISALGGVNLNWPYSLSCCGTYLTAVRPDIITPIVNKIIGSAIEAGAECIVTACVMCQLNLEARCEIEKTIPIFYLPEILSLAFEKKIHNSSFSRYFTDPKPLLKARNII